MNGRVYDFNLGRFMSVDPVIQSPGNSQSINPYSYIMNNPLAGTDPTGYAAVAEEKVEITGSRIKRSELTTKNTAGSVSIAGSKVSTSAGVISFGQAAASYATKSINASRNTPTVEIGSQASISKSGSSGGGVGGGKQKPNTLDQYEDELSGFDSELASMYQDSNDLGQTAFITSNLYMGKNDMEGILSGQLTKADFVDRAELFGTMASLTPISQGVKVGYGVLKASQLSTTTKVTSWATKGVKPDLNPGRWVIKGNASKLNYFRTGLQGGKVHRTSKFPFFKYEKNKVPFNNSITGEIPKANLSTPKGYGVDGYIKAIWGQRIIKK